MMMVMCMPPVVPYDSIVLHSIELTPCAQLPHITKQILLQACLLHQQSAQRRMDCVCVCSQLQGVIPLQECWRLLNWTLRQSSGARSVRDLVDWVGTAEG